MSIKPLLKAAMMAFALMLVLHWHGWSESMVIQAGSSVYAPPQGKIEEFVLRLKGAQIVDWQAGQAVLTLKGIDLPTGQVNQFQFDGQEVEAEGLHLQMARLMANAVTVDAFQLLNFRRLVLAQPVTAKTEFSLTDQALTAFLNLEKNRKSVEKSLNRLTGGLLPTQVVGTTVQFVPPQQVNLKLTLGMGGAVTVPVEGTARLALLNGAPRLEGLKLASLGLLLPKELGPVMAEELNDALSPSRLLKGNGTATLSGLSMQPGVLRLSGQATINKLDLQSRL